HDFGSERRVIFKTKKGGEYRDSYIRSHLHYEDIDMENIAGTRRAYDELKKKREQNRENVKWMVQNNRKKILNLISRRNYMEYIS
ncbi:hypothetical protein WA026_015442, partial [Henosepilachna vigintioctopunctata]